MSDAQETLKALEARTEAALGKFEPAGRWAEALEVLRAAGVELDGLAIPRQDPAYRPARRLRASFFLRQANALRALGRPAEAAPLAEHGFSAAMASGDRLSIAEAALSLGTTCLVNGEAERGRKLIEDARGMFEHTADPEHQQGLGWWHVVRAELAHEGLLPASPAEALAHADQALKLLRPLGNWAGVARAHAARAQANERLGDPDAARVARAAEQMARGLA